MDFAQLRRAKTREKTTVGKKNNAGREATGVGGEESNLWGYFFFLPAFLAFFLAGFFLAMPNH